GDVLERALDLVRLALDAEEPYRAAAQDLFFDAPDVLAVEPHVVAQPRSLTDERRGAELHRRAAALRHELPGLRDHDNRVLLLLEHPVDRRADNQVLQLR